MTAADVRRALTRIAHEIIEHNRGLEHVALVGLQTGGAPLARRLAAGPEGSQGGAGPMSSLDVALYRGDNGLPPLPPEAGENNAFAACGRVRVHVRGRPFTGT